MKQRIDDLFAAIRKKLDEFPADSCDRNDLLAHVRSLACWGEAPVDYPDEKIPAFPDEIHIAWAVCHPECGAREFIVEGSTQRCQYCGGLMFRTEVVRYKLDDNQEIRT